MAKKTSKKATKKPVVVEIDPMDMENKECHDTVIPPIKVPEKEKQKVPVPVVSVDYFGRYGNNLFQYVAARLFAEKNGYKMIKFPPNGFLKIKDHPEDRISNHLLETYNLVVIKDLDHIPGYYQNSGIYFNGYFQDSKHFNPYRSQIKEMFDLKQIHKNTEDIVVHLRLTDYFWIRNKWVISPLWYIQLIKKEKYRNCYIVVEPHVTNKEYLKYFENIKGVKIVTGNTAEEDFEFIRSFDRIICSNSTFCWWAAFLSDASKIYTFKPWIRDPKVNLSDIPNGKAIPGEFFRIKKLENLDWTDYWKK